MGVGRGLKPVLLALNSDEYVDLSGFAIFVDMFCSAQRFLTGKRRHGQIARTCRLILTFLARLWS